MTRSEPLIAGSRWTFRDLFERLAPVVALALLVAFTAWASPTFLRPVNLVNLLWQNSFIGIVALAEGVVIISGGIDLSVGAMVACVGVAGLWIMNTAIDAQTIVSGADMARRIHMAAIDSAARIAFARFFIAAHLGGSEGVGVALAAITMLALGTLGGWINGLIIARGKLEPFIATLATMAIFRALAEWIADGGEVRSSSATLFSRIGTSGIPLPGLSIARGVPLVLPWPVIVFLVLAIVLAVVMGRTRYGRYVYAIGSNERSAIYSAIHVKRIKLITYTLTGLFCGISALLLSSWLNSISSSGSGSLYELDAIAAVVIGGTRMQGGAGTVWGTVVGVLILGIISNMLTLMNFPPYPQGLVKGAIIIAAVVVQRAGRSRN